MAFLTGSHICGMPRGPGICHVPPASLTRASLRSRAVESLTHMLAVDLSVLSIGATYFWWLWCGGRHPHRKDLEVCFWYQLANSRHYETR